MTLEEKHLQDNVDSMIAIFIKLLKKHNLYKEKEPEKSKNPRRRHTNTESQQSVENFRNAMINDDHNNTWVSFDLTKRINITIFTKKLTIVIRKFIYILFENKIKYDNIQRNDYIGCNLCGKEQFAKCSQCNIVGYCSKKCQKQDWELSHKFKCK